MKEVVLNLVQSYKWLSARQPLIYLIRALRVPFLLLHKNFKSELKSRDIKRLTISFFHQVHP